MPPPLVRPTGRPYAERRPTFSVSDIRPARTRGVIATACESGVIAAALHIKRLFRKALGTRPVSHGSGSEIRPLPPRALTKIYAYVSLRGVRRTANDKAIPFLFLHSPSFQPAQRAMKGFSHNRGKVGRVRVGLSSGGPRGSCPAHVPFEETCEKGGTGILPGAQGLVRVALALAVSHLQRLCPRPAASR